MMKQYGFATFGGPEVFDTFQVEQPTPTEGQLLLETLGTGINPYDTLLRQGIMAKIRPLPFPIIPGSDVVGRVVSKGHGVTEFAVDDIVIAHTNLKGYGEYVIAETPKSVKKPSQFPIKLAAALPTIGITAYDMLVQQLPHIANQTLIIQGAAGGVGSLLVQIADRLGMHIITVAHSKHAKMLEALGADEVVSYDTMDLSQLNQRGDVVINAVNGGRQIDEGLLMVKPGGVFMSPAIMSPDDRDVPANVTWQTMLPTFKFHDHEALNFLAEMAADDALTIEVVKTYPFDLNGFIAAQTDITNNPGGKLVVLK